MTDSLSGWLVFGLEFEPGASQVWN